MMTRILLLMLVAAAALAEQSPRQLFERARMLDERNQNLTEAIKLYRQVVSQAKEQRALAAQAQLRVALLYERLGRKTEAQRAFRVVVAEFADQPEAVRQAREKITGPNGGTGPGVVTRKVWAGPGVDFWGSPSPDGRFLTFVDWSTGDLAIRDLQSGENRRITSKGSLPNGNQFAVASLLSPDGKQVAYQWTRNERRELHISGVDGSNPRVLCCTEGPEFVFPSEWSRDGKYILASLRRKDQVTQIALISAADGSLRIVKTLDHRHGGKLILSPDGRFVVYSFFPKENPSQRDIYLVAVDGSQETALVQHPAQDLALGWAPDGRSILFASDRSGMKDAWLLPVADGKAQGPPVLVKQNLGYVHPMGFTRSGSFYYGMSMSQADVYIATLDPATGKLLSPPGPAAQRSAHGYSHAAWSPDGRYLAFVVEEGPYNERTFSIRSLETGAERQLPVNLARLFTHRFPWSPDGRWLLVAGFDRNNRHAIYKVDIQTGDLTPLADRHGDEYLSQPAWSPDGKAVFYRSGNRVLRRDLETAAETEVLTAEGLQFWALAPDGRQFALLRAPKGKPGGTSLEVVSAAGSPPRELLKVPEADLFLSDAAWTADGRHLYFLKADARQQASELWRIPAAGGPAQQVELPWKKFRGLSVHPNGKQIALTVGVPERATEVWVMEDFLPILRAARQ